MAGILRHVENPSGTASLIAYPGSGGSGALAARWRLALELRALPLYLPLCPGPWRGSPLVLCSQLSPTVSGHWAMTAPHCTLIFPGALGAPGSAAYSDPTSGPTREMNQGIGMEGGGCLAAPRRPRYHAPGGQEDGHSDTQPDIGMKCFSPHSQPPNHSLRQGVAYSSNHCQSAGCPLTRPESPPGLLALLDSTRSSLLCSRISYLATKHRIRDH